MKNVKNLLKTSVSDSYIHLQFKMFSTNPQIRMPLLITLKPHLRLNVNPEHVLAQLPFFFSLFCPITTASTFLPQRSYSLLSLFFNFILFYLFIFGALGLGCCTRAFSSCGEWWLLLLQSMGSRHAGFSSCGSRALERRLSSCGAGA